jgi:magnesium-transporting ATPase (P-type)
VQVIDATVGEHHELSVHEVVLLLESDAHVGLSEHEVHARRERFGPNVLPQLHRRGPLVRFLAQFCHPLIYVLIAAAALTLLLGDIADCAVIVGVVVLNAAVGFVQESRAEHALEALVAMVGTSAVVIRDGERITTSSSDVVPGDLILLSAGDKVPADLRLVESRELRVDESALTGESVPVAKSSLELPLETALGDRNNMAYSGTLVVAGQGKGIVIATGGDTEMGQIHRLVGSTEGVQTPLTRKIAHFSRILTVAIVMLAGLSFAVGIARGEAWDDMVNAAVALAVGAIPEGLPAAVTITLAIAVGRMARRHAVVRSLPAVETLGSTTVICTDKTGTLTANEMTVQVVCTDAMFNVAGTGYAPVGEIRRDGECVTPLVFPALRECLTAGVLCNDARLVVSNGNWEVIGDPTEGALITSARKAGLDPADLNATWPRVDSIPFESARGFMATAHRRAQTPQTVIYVKGAPERVLSMCTSAVGTNGEEASLDTDAVLRVAEELGAQGLRVLAFARAAREHVDELRHEHVTNGFTFLGLQAMADPPRPDAMAAVAACRAAGIEVKMITGDQATTAAAIAERFGLGRDRLEQHQPRVVTGNQLAATSKDEFAELVERTSVFARVSPEQKLLLVESLQRHHHVVAMTGDGVNDAPALKQADIGVAMGSGGTEVAKESADMVLTDDSFASIEATVEEGRGVFDNLTKFIVWTLPTNAGEGLVVLAGIIAGTLLPILPIQILWINMTTAVALGLTLAFEPKEAGIMSRRPRHPDQPILTPTLIRRVLLVSAILVISAFALFSWERQRGAPVDEARTIVVNAFVMVELAYLLSCRSLDRAFFAVGLFTNRILLAGMFTAVGLQLAFTYVPFMQGLFETAALDVAAWGRVLAVAIAGFLLVEAEKALHRRRADARRRTTECAVR